MQILYPSLKWNVVKNHCEMLVQTPTLSNLCVGFFPIFHASHLKISVNYWWKCRTILKLKNIKYTFVFGVVAKVLQNHLTIISALKVSFFLKRPSSFFDISELCIQFKVQIFWWDFYTTLYIFFDVSEGELVGWFIGLHMWNTPSHCLHT